MVIPETWEKKTIGDIASFKGGSQPALSTFSSVMHEGYIRLVQIRDYKTDKYKTYIPIFLAKRFCNSDDVMIGRYGPPIFQILRGLTGAYNVALIKATSTGVDKEYLYYTLKRDDIFKYIDLLSRRSSGQTGVDLDGLKNYEIIIPKSTEEQTVIAKALSDIDNLIVSLEKLIEKKKDIKQVAMKELLTGKKRLAGFDCEWNFGTIADICAVTKGSIITEKQVRVGKVPVIAGGKKPAYYHNVSNRKANTITISASGASAGYVAFYKEPIFASDCSTIEVSDDYCIKYIYYTLLLRQKELFAMQTGGAQPHIHPSDVKNVRVFLFDKKEQEAIAIILSDVDKEIEQLEEKLAKYQQIKQGMMQELLTSRIRLV